MLAQMLGGAGIGIVFFKTNTFPFAPKTLL